MEAWSHLKKGWSFLKMLSFQAKSTVRPSGETSLGSTLRKAAESDHTSYLAAVLSPQDAARLLPHLHTAFASCDPSPLLLQKFALRRTSFIHLYTWVWVPVCGPLSLMELHFKTYISLGKIFIVKGRINKEVRKGFEEVGAFLVFLKLLLGWLVFTECLPCARHYFIPTSILGGR